MLRGVNKLYKSPIKPKYVAQVLLASMIPIVVIIAVSTPIQQIMKLLILQMRLNLGF